VGSPAAAERTLASIQNWIEKHLRRKVNGAKSGTGRVWERKFLGFRLNRNLRIGIAPERIERFQAKVRERGRGNQSRTSTELRDLWQSYIRGGWGYFPLAEDRDSIFRLEGWIRRHTRKCFWLRWHDAAGREHALRRLGMVGRRLKAAFNRPRRLAYEPDRLVAERAFEPDPATPRFLRTIRSCGTLTPLGSTAGCGKPHVRWGRHLLTRRQVGMKADSPTGLSGLVREEWEVATST
jgi:hypothetical protein